MNTKQIAALLGRRGGKRRAQTLTKEQKKNIARMGGLAKKQSQLVAQRISENFLYLKVIQALAPKPPKIKRLKTFKGSLAGIYL